MPIPAQPCLNDRSQDFAPSAAIEPLSDAEATEPRVGGAQGPCKSVASTSTLDPNFVTGCDGLIAIDKVGNKVLFLDPLTYETVLTLAGFAPRVHEVAVSPDRTRAYVPIYGDGIHGNNPNPGHLIAVFDLRKRGHIGDISTAPYLAPHGLRWSPTGQLYCVCETAASCLK